VQNELQMYGDKLSSRITIKIMWDIKVLKKSEKVWQSKSGIKKRKDGSYPAC
jgi:hypothetical protein